MAQATYPVQCTRTSKHGQRNKGGTLGIVGIPRMLGHHNCDGPQNSPTVQERLPVVLPLVVLSYSKSILCRADGIGNGGTSTTEKSSLLYQLALDGDREASVL
eukprot:2481223-Rhodomonas_salina.1